MTDVSRRALLAGPVLLATPSIVRAQALPTLVIATQGIPPHLEPGNSNSNIALRITYNVFDKLVSYRYRGDGSAGPGLATSWEYEAPDRLRFTLRDGVRFHPGTGGGGTMTAEDVAFTFGPERMSRQGAPTFASTRGFFPALERVEAVDRLTVRFHMSRPDPFLHLRLGGWLAEIVSARAYAAAPSFEAWSRRPVGTGPYRVAEIVPGDRLVVEAFAEGWRGAPPFGRIEFRDVPEVAARIAGLAAGDYHLATDLPPDQLGTIERYADLDTTGGAILNYRLLVFSQQREGAIRDPKFRQALAMGIDCKSIVDSLWAGRTAVPNGYQWEAFGPMYVEAPQQPHDPDRARAALRASSYRGEELIYGIQPDYYTNETATAEIIAAQLGELGVKIRLQVFEAWQAQDAARPHMRNWSNTLLFPDPVSGIWRLWGPGTAPQRNGYWTNAEFNAEGQVLASDAPQARRRAAIERMLAIWHREDPAGMILHQNAIFYGKQKRLEWSPIPLQYMDLGPGAARLGA